MTEESIARGQTVTFSDLGWVAGMIDGEGTIRLAHDPKTNRAWVTLSVANSHMGALEHIQSLFGVGKITAGVRRSLSHKPGYNWRVFSRQACVVLRQIGPFLRIKHQHAAVALEFQRNQGRSGRNLSLEEKNARRMFLGIMSGLNRKGVAA